VGSTLFGDAAVIGRFVAGLPDPRIEPEVAHEFFRRREPMDVADGRQYAHRHGGVHASNRHQPLDSGLLERLLGEALVHVGEFGAKAVEFSGMAKDDASLVLGERLSLQPSPSTL
jgi:hypothetical protein